MGLLTRRRLLLWVEVVRGEGAAGLGFIAGLGDVGSRGLRRLIQILISLHLLLLVVLKSGRLFFFLEGARSR